MRLLAGLLGAGVILIVLWDTFETVVMPRTVISRLRLTTFFYRHAWRAWAAIASRVDGRRDKFLSTFGPLSLIMLLAAWAVALVLAFALLHWSFGSRFNVPDGHFGFSTDVYVSGTTLFTLGLGDVTPKAGVARALVVLEAGLGLGFLAIVIGYLPVLYQAFSRREVAISLLDARAGSPPTASELLRRHGVAGQAAAIPDLLRDFEHWAAEVLESHLSYPILAYYRSQHDRESWLSTLTTVLDVSALVSVGVGNIPPWQAELTFAMARHAVVDLALVFYTPPHAPEKDRLPPADLARLRSILCEAGLPLRDGAEADAQLAHLREKYEPYMQALSDSLLVSLPPWIGDRIEADNWQTSAFEGGHL
ncbi:MAG TPA: potassium channel family protein [Armatimonadota bacterium]|jgi:hypothetical protein